MILICSHSNCDLDAFASMLGAHLLFPNSKICLTGALDNSVKRVINDFETHLKSIDKQKNHTFEFIKEKNVNFDLLRSIILVDNSNFDRLGNIGKYINDHPELPVICFDHHEECINKQRFIYYKQENFGSCTTMIVRELMNRGINFDQYIASIFAMGIFEDTGSLLNVNTQAEDFSALSYLMSMGMSISLVKKYIKPVFSAYQLEIMNELIKSKEMIEIKGIPVHFFKLELKNELYGISELIQYVRQSESIQCLFCFVKINNKIIIIARSDYSFIEVNKILSTFEGGGHPSSASAHILDHSLEEIQTETYLLLIKCISDHGTVKDYMTKQVETIDINSSILDAYIKLNANHFGALLITDNDKLQGIITKKDIGQALMHHLEEHSIEMIMSTDLITIKEDTSIFKAQEIMLEKNIGRLPVMYDSEIKGIISRRDLLKAIYFSNQKYSLEQFDNISSKLKRLEPDLYKTIISIGVFADSCNVNVFLVGGFVRDLLLDKICKDIDIVVEENAIDFARKYSEHFNYHLVTFPKFKTAIVSFPNIGKIDFSSSRSEYYEKPGSLPIIEKSSIRNDLFRRDFTINSIAIQINSGNFGRLIDFFGGRRDLQQKMIKVLNNLSFSDDPTRILRAIRFEQRFQFIIEKKTLRLMSNSLKLGALKNIAVERIQQELIKACEEVNAPLFFLRLQELEILKIINPNLLINSEKKLLLDKVQSVNNWITESLDIKIKKWVVYFIILSNDLSERSATKFFKQYKFSNILHDSFIDFKSIQRVINEKWNYESVGSIYCYLKNMKREAILSYLIIEKNHEKKTMAKNFLLYYYQVKTFITGHDLIKMGFPENKIIKEILNDVLTRKLDDMLYSKEDELKYVKDVYSEFIKNN